MWIISMTPDKYDEMAEKLFIEICGIAGVIDGK
jgi:hypothetical protein